MLSTNFIYKIICEFFLKERLMRDLVLNFQVFGQILKFFINNLNKKIKIYNLTNLIQT